MQGRQRFFSIFTSLCILFSGSGAAVAGDPPQHGGTGGGSIAETAGHTAGEMLSAARAVASEGDAALASALYERVLFEGGGIPGGDSGGVAPQGGDSSRAALSGRHRPGTAEILLAKARCQFAAGDYAGSSASLARIPLFSAGDSLRAEILRGKILSAYMQEDFDSFEPLLGEAIAMYGDRPALSAAREYCEAGRSRRRSPGAAMILSIIPGLGNAYSGDWKGAGRHFAINAPVIALGVGAFTQSLYAAAFAGSGMILGRTYSANASDAVRQAEQFNLRAKKEFYRPVFDLLCEDRKAAGETPAGR